MHYEGEGGASVQRKNLNRFVRYEAEVEQSENTHSLSLHKIQSSKRGQEATKRSSDRENMYAAV